MPGLGERERGRKSSLVETFANFNFQFGYCLPSKIKCRKIFNMAQFLVNFKTGVQLEPKMWIKIPVTGDFWQIRG